MPLLLRLYDRLIHGLACLAGISLAVVTLLVIHDVISRNLHLTPFRAASAVVEYVLLFSTMAAAPWLVRINGHVSVSSILGLLPETARTVANRLSLIVAMAALAVLLGSLARIDVGALLIAGLLPGLVLAGLYVFVIWLMIRLDPDAAPGYATRSHAASEIIGGLLRDVAPMGLVIFAVIGMILLGWATPTESAACGAAAVLILAAAYRRLSWQVIVKSMRGTVKVSAMMLIIILGSTTFSQLLAFSGASRGLIAFATGFEQSAYAMLLIMLLVLIVLGMFMDQLSIMMLTLPIFMPLVAFYHFDPVWFGVVMLLALELSLATPPFSLLLFVMMGVSPPGTTMRQIVAAATPFLLCTEALIGLLVLFPKLALWLPGLM